jgi:hypothetical protein
LTQLGRHANVKTRACLRISCPASFHTPLRCARAQLEARTASFPCCSIHYFQTGTVCRRTWIVPVSNIFRGSLFYPGPSQSKFSYCRIRNGYKRGPRRHALSPLAPKYEHILPDQRTPPFRASPDRDDARHSPFTSFTSPSTVSSRTQSHWHAHFIYKPRQSYAHHTSPRYTYTNKELLF